MNFVNIFFQEFNTLFRAVRRTGMYKTKKEIKGLS